MTKFEEFEKIIADLRAPGGCPWDREQTHSSLKRPCIEEAAEVICGINILEETGNPDNLKEELGDLLMQVVMHARIAEEEGYFTMDDVIQGIIDKMVRRHPHVFGQAVVSDSGEVLKRWDEIKKQEKAGKEWEEDRLPAAFREAKELIDAAAERKGFSVKQADGSGLSGTSAKAAAGTAKTGILHTAAGRIAVIAAGMCIAGGGIFGVFQLVKHVRQAEPARTADSLIRPAADDDGSREPEEAELREEDSPSQIEGNPSKEELTDDEQSETVSEDGEITGASILDPSAQKECYKAALTAVQNQESGYEFPSAGSQVQEYRYFLCDMEGDGINELVVGAVFPENVFMAYDCRIYTCVQAGDEVQIKPVGTDFVTLELYIPADRKGLYNYSFSRGTGSVEVNRLTVSGDGIAETPEYQFTMGDTQSQQFHTDNEAAQWKSVTDLSGLDVGNSVIVY